MYLNPRVLSTLTEQVPTERENIIKTSLTSFLQAAQQNCWK